eukprot:TRINITY_DN41950_c0_g1_i1.p1 TRINITY_DN41950_c0_g1~~TRINITY_DN41950_c0_g1_i1.p1  ORF type:complete len:424 (+),score=73.32 TRINITY_DN41950_c0_g1_i1:107-1273(+)
MADDLDAPAGDEAKGATPLGDAHAAGCVLKSTLLRHLDRAGQAGTELVVWDPFCGRGTLLLEALGICLGVPPASPAMRFPFVEIPRFDRIGYSEVVRSLQLRPHPALSQLKLLGTHEDPRQVELAKCNLESFMSTLPRPRFAAPSPLWADVGQEGDTTSKRRLACDIDFRELRRKPGGSWSPRELRGQQLLVLTNVPYGRKADRGVGRDYERLATMLQRQADHGNLLDAYCLSGREDFKRVTGLDWRTELRFSNSGIVVELLRWTGRTSDITPFVPRKRLKESSGGKGQDATRGGEGGGAVQKEAAPEPIQWPGGQVSDGSTFAGEDDDLSIAKSLVGEAEGRRSGGGAAAASERGGNSSEQRETTKQAEQPLAMGRKTRRKLVARRQ